jgi:hypothetical protein
VRDSRPAVVAERCANVVNKQSLGPVQAGGGPKSGGFAPANCDHFFFLADVPIGEHQKPHEHP